MDAALARAAVAAAVSTAGALGLDAVDAVVLQDSNRLTLRLRPCDSLVRVATLPDQRGAEFEVEVARRIAETRSPLAVLDPRVDPRVYVRGGFFLTFWTYYEPASPGPAAPPDYARALADLHAAMRHVDLPAAPHFTDRVAEAQRLVEEPALSPDLAHAGRELLTDALHLLKGAILNRRAPEQLLHGEPHPGNLLRTSQGLLFIDLETCCRGPLEFDVAHAPVDVAAHYADLDPDLLEACRALVLAMVAAWRWDRRDQFPDGRRMGDDLLRQLRAALDGLPRL
jgi:hypothetical protein